MVFLANLFQCSGHDLWSVVYGEDNIRHTSGGKSLDLVENHGLVAEFNERLGEGESLVVNVGQLCLDKMYLLQTYKRAKRVTHDKIRRWQGKNTCYTFQGRGQYDRRRRSRW